MSNTIRRTLIQVQDTYIEGGQNVPEPTKLVAAIAVIANPWFGRGFVEDLSPEVRKIGPVVGKLLTEMILDITGDKIEGYDKASVVGSGGE